MKMVKGHVRKNSSKNRVLRGWEIAWDTEYGMENSHNIGLRGGLGNILIAIKKIIIFSAIIKSTILFNT